MSKTLLLITPSSEIEAELLIRFWLSLINAIFSFKANSSLINPI